METWIFRGYLRNREGKVVPWAMSARGPFQFDPNLKPGDLDYGLHWVKIRMPRFLVRGAVNLCMSEQKTVMIDCLDSVLQRIEMDREIEVLDREQQPIVLCPEKFIRLR